MKMCILCDRIVVPKSEVLLLKFRVYNIRACLPQWYLCLFLFRERRIKVLFPPENLILSISRSKMNVPRAWYLPWSRSLAPSEQRLDAVPTEVLFSVGAAEFLARFLHSNTTRSLHCLWQFIPQSVHKTLWSGSLSVPSLGSQNHIPAALLAHMPVLFSGARTPNVPNEPSIFPLPTPMS